MFLAVGKSYCLKVLATTANLDAVSALLGDVLLEASR